MVIRRGEIEEWKVREQWLDKNNDYQQVVVVAVFFFSVKIRWLAMVSRFSRSGNFPCLMCFYVLGE